MESERFLIDTNIFILLFNDRLTESFPDGEIGYSIITEMELRSFPALTSAEEILIRDQLATFMGYGIDDAVKEEAIHLRRTIRLKLPDAIIAATAIVYDAVLVTNDKQLHTVPGLNCRELAMKP
ncbi:MAG: type II toxin-antitoxin system VapC family toxin [Anaerolineaceae bacterium]|nr:type II toxin-antitoxin system VapC family toxin [Anaerolineaceae bacterium]MCB9100232.1 type II toxin-antitoxin system VapC family toxin [Anaerolineales bacterium]